MSRFTERGINKPESATIVGIRDEKVYNPDGTEMVINKTARKALWAIIEEMPELKTVQFRNSTEGDRTDNEFKSKKDPAMYIYPKPDEKHQVLLSRHMRHIIDNAREKGRIDYFAQKMEGLGMTDDVIATFILIHEIGHFIADKNKSYTDWKEKENGKLRTLKEAEEREDYIKLDKREKGVFLDNLYRNLPDEAEADNFATDWMNGHMYLFDEKINPDLGKWSVIDDPIDN